MKLVPEESTSRQAFTCLLQVKKFAEEGSSDALKLYEKLKPDYLAFLRR